MMLTHCYQEAPASYLVDYSTIKFKFKQKEIFCQSIPQVKCGFVKQLTKVINSNWSTSNIQLNSLCNKLKLSSVHVLIC